MMKTLEKIFSWLILAALIAVVALQIVRNHKEKTENKLPTIELTEIQSVFPEAAKIQTLDTAYFRILDAKGQALGSVLLSSPYADDVKGYAGKTPLMIVVGPDDKIAQVQLLENGETPGFVNRVVNSGFLESWNGLSLNEALDKELDAVSGATFSSTGIKKSLQKRLSVAARQEANFQKEDRNIFQSICILFVIAMALLCFFMPKHTKMLRYIALLLSIIVIGFWRNALMSLSLFYGWLTSGISWPMEWALLLIFVLAVLLPLFTGRAFYCQYLCPMGAMQEFIGKANKNKINLPQKVVTALLIIRKLFLLTILILLLVGVTFNLAYFEPFSVFSVKSVTLFSVILAAVILIISLFVNRCWCHFLCPTGLLFELVRKIGPKKKSQEVKKD